MPNSDDIQSIKQSLIHMEKKIDTLTELLTGNGEPEKGLIVRVDRLTEDAKRQAWWIGTLIVAAISFSIEFLHRMIK